MSQRTKPMDLFTARAMLATTMQRIAEVSAKADACPTKVVSYLYSQDLAQLRALEMELLNIIYPPTSPLS